MFFNGFDGLGGYGGINGGGSGIDPMAGLIWQLFEQSGEPGYYMLFNDLYGDKEETDHRRD